MSPSETGARLNVMNLEDVGTEASSSRPTNNIYETAIFASDGTPRYDSLILDVRRDRNPREGYSRRHDSRR